MQNKVRFLAFPFALLLLASCDRMQVNNSRISLEIPQTISKKLSASSNATLTLQHLVIQVTGDDIKEPLLVIHDNKDSKAAIPTSVSLDIPSGSDRLIQVIAAYARGEDEDATIYYGDIKKSLSGAAEVVDVPVEQLGSSSQMSARISGRFLTGPNQGPTGELVLTYAPAGKPEVTVTKERMVSGWFETLIFDSVPLNYTLPDGTSMGQNWTTQSVAPSAANIQIYSGSAYRQYFNAASAGSEWSQKSPELKIMGFFSNNAALLSNKKVCVISEVGGESIFHRDLYKSQNKYHPLPFKHYPSASQIQKDPDFYNISGGRPLADCSSLPNSERYVNHLYMGDTLYGNQPYYDIEHMLDIRGLLKPSMGTTSTSTHYATQGDASSAYIVIAPLPGAENFINSYQVWKMPPPPPAGSYNNENSCRTESLIAAGGQFIATKPLNKTSSGDFIIRKTDIPNHAQLPTDYVVCLARDEKPLGRIIDTYQLIHAAPATKIRTHFGGPPKYSAPNPTKDVCNEGSIYLSSAEPNQIAYNPYSDLSVTLSADFSGPVTMFHSDKDCTTTAQSYLIANFQKGETHKTFYYKTSVYGFNTTLTNNKSLTSDAIPYTMMRDISSSAPTRMDLIVSDQSNSNLNLYPGGCTKVNAVFKSNEYVSNFSDTVDFQWTEVDGTTTAAKPSDIQYFSDCQSVTPITSLNPQNGFASFVIKVGTTVTANKAIKLGDFYNIVNPTPVFHKLKVSFPAGYNVPVNSAKCHPLEVGAYTTQNQLYIPAFTIPFNLNPHQEVNTGHIGMFADSGCTMPVSNFEITVGSSTKTVYVLPSVAGLVTYDAYSMFAATYTEPSQQFKLNYSPLPLNVVGALGTIPTNQTRTYQVEGGIPPYTVEVVTGTTLYNYISPTGPNYTLTVSTSMAAGSPLKLSIRDSMGVVTLLNLTVVNP